MALMTGGQALARQLHREGIRVIFGLPGVQLYHALDGLHGEEEIRFINTRHEQATTYMADGYARASGQPGIVIAGQNGPGATNLVTGIAQANAAFSPIISLAGDITSEHRGKNGFQEIDQQALFEPITKKTLTVMQTQKIPKILNDILY